MTRPELTREQIAEANQKTLKDLHPGWTIQPGDPWTATPWTAKRGRDKLLAADSIDLHDQLRRQA